MGGGRRRSDDDYFPHMGSLGELNWFQPVLFRRRHVFRFLLLVPFEYGSVLLSLGDTSAGLAVRVLPAV
jgi:hypothetical protein